MSKQSRIVISIIILAIFNTTSVILPVHAQVSFAKPLPWLIMPETMVSSNPAFDPNLISNIRTNSNNQIRILLQKVGVYEHKLPVNLVSRHLRMMLEANDRSSKEHRAVLNPVLRPSTSCGCAGVGLSTNPVPTMAVTHFSLDEYFRQFQN